MLLAPAFPGRSRTARVSPVASAKQYIGWNPNPPLKCAAVSALFSEWISCNDESMSNTTVAFPVVADDRRHTRARTSAIASHGPARVTGSIWRNVRYSVESDGTDPNRSGWER